MRINLLPLARAAGSTKRQTYCMKTNTTKVPMRLRLKEIALRWAARVIPIYPLKRAALKAHYINWETSNLEELEQMAREHQFDPGDVFNGHPFHWSRRARPGVHEDEDLEWLRAANERLAAHDAEHEPYPDWDFSTILAENLKRGR